MVLLVSSVPLYGGINKDLLEAIGKGDIEVVKELIYKGADVK